MKKLFLLLALICSLPVLAQDEAVEEQANAVDESENNVVDGIVAKQHIKFKRNLKPHHVREASVLWSKTIWRMIDLREKQNLYLYYPTNSAVDDRRSLIRTLLDAISSGELDAYSPNTDNEFEAKLPLTDIYEKLGITYSDSIVSVDPETGESVTKYIYDMKNAPVDLVKKVLVKEVWFFDSRYTRLEVRILGLCPIAIIMNEDGTRLDQVQLFWVYYPAAERFLAKQEAYSAFNDAQRGSIHDMLQGRKFGSYIFKESNVYNNRIITSYAKGMASNIEAQRIENSIFQKEHDMWAF
ncbi:MAG: gliding motility protein GldN [Bacteroidales bacterium]|nr:gliding motility protein GldN [Bacteroidales bacterium]